MGREAQISTQAERDFTFHYYQEDCRHIDRGPAHQWANEHGIPNGSMIVFGYWEQRNNPQWLNQLLEEEPPPFQIPWSSQEEFFQRVHLLLEVYPQVRDITPVQPRKRTALVHS